MRGNKKSIWIIWITLMTVVPAVATPVLAQEWTVIDDEDWCREAGRGYCEVREITLSADRDDFGVRSTNGDITVEAWEGDEIYIRALIRVKGRGSTAVETASEVRISTKGTIEARGPKRSGWWIFGGNKNWSVSYRVKVPVRFDMDVHTTNGSLSVTGVSGEIDAGTTNGSITLVGVGGDVTCGTTNGGIKVVLDGDVWKGEGLDIHATNGGISVAMPEGYSATLDASTTNGGISVDHRIRLQKKSHGKLSGTIGDGGPTIRARTTNGGVRFLETDQTPVHDDSTRR
jgi:hypothetical protein